MAAVLTAFLYVINKGNEFCGAHGRGRISLAVPAVAALILAADVVITVAGCAFDYVLRSEGAKLRFSPLFVFVLMLAFCNHLPDTLFNSWMGCLFSEGYGMVFAFIWCWFVALACAAREVFTVVSLERS